MLSRVKQSKASPKNSHLFSLMLAVTPPAIGLSIMPRARPIDLPALYLEGFAGFAGRADNNGESDTSNPE